MGKYIIKFFQFVMRTFIILIIVVGIAIAGYALGSWISNKYK